ncbi:MAG: hypothetical protein RLZZ401_633, partial [Pseudomonadota bacterium]
QPLGVEFCGTALTSRSNSKPERVSALLQENPHFVFADVERKGYGVLDITHQRLGAQLRVVSDVTQAQTEVQTLAAFGVEVGQARVERL